MGSKGGENMKSKSYLIIKPDGLTMKDKIFSELSSDFKITHIIPIKDFCPLAKELYLDDDARERGNEAIIIGINTVWSNEYSKSAILIIVEAKDDIISQADFVLQVCQFKKKFRKKHIPNAYIEFIIAPFEIDYKKFEAKVPNPELLKKRLNKEDDMYHLQLNGLHCPDSIESYYREINLIKKYLKSGA